MSSSFEKLVSRLPYSWEKIVGMGVSHFIREQEPHLVSFNVRVDDDSGDVIGWEIKVDASEDSVEDAKDFWLNHVEDRL